MKSKMVTLIIAGIIAWIVAGIIGLLIDAESKFIWTCVVGLQGGTVDVFDFTGAKVYSNRVDDLQAPFPIDLSNLAGGVYLVKVQCGDESYLRKVLIE